MRRNALEVQKLKRGAEQCGVCPIVDFDRMARVPGEQILQLGHHAQRSVDDLGGEGCIGAARRSALELGVEGHHDNCADNLRMAIAQAGKTAPPEPWSEGEFSQRILVVGGGVSGLSAAREAAAAGHEVLLVERADTLGGWARKWGKRMPHRPPYRDPQDNDIEALIAAVEGDPAITVKTGATVTKTEGMPGKFTVQLSQGGAETVGAIVVATGSEVQLAQAVEASDADVDRLSEEVLLHLSRLLCRESSPRERAAEARGEADAEQ